MRTIILPILILLAAHRTAFAEDASSLFQKQVLPILKAHCTECHSGAQPKAKLNLAGSRSLTQLRTESHHWYRVLERVEAGTMPPEDAEPLKPAAKQTLVAWIHGQFTNLLIQQQRQEGRSKFRRFSRNEYANTIQDILGIRPPVARLLPDDGRVDGYDKVSAALPFSAPATEGHLKIAEEMVAHMFRRRQTKQTFRLLSSGSHQSKGHILELKDNWNVSFNSDVNSGPLKSSSLRKVGLHRLRMSVYGYQTDKPLPVGIYVGSTGSYPQILELLKVIDIPPGKPSIVQTDIYLGACSNGRGIRLVPLGLGVPVPKNTLASELGVGPGMALQWIDVEELEGTLPGQDLLFAEIPMAVQTAFKRNLTLKSGKVARDELQAFIQNSFGRIGTRLNRRDLSDTELPRIVQSYMASVDAGARLRPAFETEVVAMMTSPDFLCVLEEPGKLTNFALASRLSYFLWNSTPDAELLEVARQGKLTDSNILKAQTERLLNDPKSERFVIDFLDQWLGLWGINNTTPDKDLYPEYDNMLKISSTLETQATFRHMLDKNLSVRDFVAPSWAMLNARLAKHYGIPGVDNFKIRRFRLPKDAPFGGLWTQAAIMKVTANGTLTSPVKRGVWVAERLLGVKIPPPPANVAAVDPDTRGAKTLREQLALHRQKGSCKACHAKFDPYGFALESFDVMGNFRTKYRIADDWSGSAKPVFTSKTVTHQTPGHAVDIKAAIKGTRELWLVVNPLGDPGADHAAWMEPRLVGPKGELKITDLDWKFASQGWGQTKRNTSPAGTPMRVNGKSVPYGIGTHSPAVLGFDIPEGYETFLAQGGLDNSAADLKRGKLRFEVFTKRPPQVDNIKWMDGLPVNCSGTTPAGTNFASVQELRQLLAKKPDQLARGVTRHLLTYATGEPATPIDQPTIEAIVSTTAKDEYGLRSIVHAVIQSELFRTK